MMRAMKGVAATVSGTIAAAVPIEVPATSRVNGMMATTRMMNGVERVALTIAPISRLRIGAANSSPRALVARNTPSGSPNSVPSAGRDTDHEQGVERRFGDGAQYLRRHSRSPLLPA